MTSDNKNRHTALLLLTLGLFIALQALMGYLGTIRSTQYYTRLFYIVEINIILTASLSLINGYTGQFSLGHAGFMAIGAYISALLTTIIPGLLLHHPLMPMQVWAHVVFIIAIIAGGGVSAIFGFIIGFPSLRLRGDYLAIVTLAASEVIRALLRFSDFLGGPRGIPGIPTFSNAFYMGIFFIGSIWLMRNYVYSHYGRCCIAVRDNEIASSAMAINPTFQKVSAFMLGAFFAGIAGGMFAHMSHYINPDNFNVLKSLELLIFLYVGGFQTLTGAIIGATLFTLVPELIRLVNLESWRMVIYPVTLIIVMRFKQDGLMGNKEFGILMPWKYKEMQLLRKQRATATIEPPAVTTPALNDGKGV